MVKRKGKEISLSGITAPDWSMVDYTLKPYKDKGIQRSYKSNFQGALWYIHYEVKPKKITAEFLKYALKHFDKKDVQKLKVLSDFYFSTIGKYTYLISKGANLAPEEIEKIEVWYQDLLVKAEKVQAKKDLEEAEEDNKPKAPTISIQQRMRDQVSPLCGHWDGFLDELLDGNISLKRFDPYTDIKAQKTGVEVKPAHAKIIKDMYQHEYEEAKEVCEWKDPEIKEAYGHLTSAKVRKDFVAFYEAIFAACDTIINTQKATRKPRKPKAVSKQKLIEKLKYQQSESSLGLASINPLSIIDATTLWVYNTKTRKLGVYVADDMMHSLSVKGTTIINYDSVKSSQKTVRKPEILKDSAKLARTKFEKLYNELTTTETKMNGRINENTILIKSF